MTHVFHRHTHADLPTVARGEGPYLIDTQGKRYLDASGGAAVSCLGHSNAQVIAAIKAQLDAVPYAHTSFFTNKPQEALADYLVGKAPPGIDRVYFVSGGSEAIEAGLKLAYQFFHERGERDRQFFVARRQSYHGNTLGALAVGGNQWRRAQFQPILIDTQHIAPCYPYRDKGADETEQDYGVRVADELQSTLDRLGPQRVIAFVAEPVVGATAGALPPVPGYFKRIREICDKNGILLLLDEVMCGMGRTGTLFACEQEGVTPDLVAVAKGLGAGYQPLGALLCSGDIFSTIRDGSGFFQHGHTYLGHATACAGGLAVQKYIDEHDLLENVRRQGEALSHALHERFGNHAHIGDIRGRGLFIGLELVADRATKTPFSPSTALHTRIKSEAMSHGLMVYPMSGTIDGVRGHHILLAPPYIIDQTHVAEITEKLGLAVDAAIGALHV